MTLKKFTLLKKLISNLLIYMKKRTALPFEKYLIECKALSPYLLIDIEKVKAQSSPNARFKTLSYRILQALYENDVEYIENLKQSMREFDFKRKVAEGEIDIKTLCKNN